jgi:hypothetical protein
MTEAATTNGRPQRKTLSSQLDRLENIIDALANGLPDTIAEAVRQAVGVAAQEALQAVFRELLTSPEILGLVAGQVPPEFAAGGEPGGSRLRKAFAAVGTKLGDTKRWVGGKLSGATAWVGLAAGGLNLRELGRKLYEIRRPLARSAVVGLLTGLVGYLTGPVASAVALGLCGAGLCLAISLLAPVAMAARMQPQAA